MTEGKQTPGPWFVTETAVTFEIRNSEGIRVFSTSWHSHLRNPYPLKAESAANARLAASAPDLLSELKQARHYVKAIYDRTTSPNENEKVRRDLTQIDAAIAKAEGGAA